MSENTEKFKFTCAINLIPNLVQNLNPKKNVTLVSNKWQKN